MKILIDKNGDALNSYTRNKLHQGPGVRAGCGKTRITLQQRFSQLWWCSCGCWGTSSSQPFQILTIIITGAMFYSHFRVCFERYPPHYKTPCSLKRSSARPAQLLQNKEATELFENPTYLLLWLPSLLCSHHYVHVHHQPCPPVSC